MDNENVLPGSFRPAPENQHPAPEVQTPREVKAEVHPDLLAKYQLFDREVHPAKGVVYHPCGANDCSPSMAFPDSKVVYVELDEQAVKALQKEGFEAHYASALEYDPGDVNILIMLNPQIPPTVPATHVTEGGHVICNNYHATATAMRDNPDFQLRGLIRVAKGRGLLYDTDHPEEYWKEIDTEEEFANAPFDWGAVNYAMAGGVVEAFTGKRENVLVEYKKIIEQAREQNAKMLTEHPEWADLLGDTDKKDVLMLNHEGQQHVISARFPRKKGTVDDLFVFERVPKPQSIQELVQGSNVKQP